MDGKPKKIGTTIGTGRIAAAVLAGLAAATVAQRHAPAIKPPYMRAWVKRRQGGSPGADARAAARRRERDANNAIRGMLPSNKARQHAMRAAARGGD